MQPDPWAALLDVREAAARGISLLGGLGLRGFLEDERTRWAVYSQFIIAGEAAHRIPPDWQERHPGIPWPELVGMRNRLVHGYDDILWEVVWETAEKDFPPLIAAIDAVFEAKDREERT